MSARNDLSVCTTVSSFSGCLRGLLCFSLQQRVLLYQRPTVKQGQAHMTLAAYAVKPTYHMAPVPLYDLMGRHRPEVSPDMRNHALHAVCAQWMGSEQHS